MLLSIKAITFRGSFIQKEIIDLYPKQETNFNYLSKNITISITYVRGKKKATRNIRTNTLKAIFK